MGGRSSARLSREEEAAEAALYTRTSGSPSQQHEDGEPLAPDQLFARRRPFEGSGGGDGGDNEDIGVLATEVATGSQSLREALFKNDPTNNAIENGPGDDEDEEESAESPGERVKGCGPHRQPGQQRVAGVVDGWRRRRSTPRRAKIAAATRCPTKCSTPTTGGHDPALGEGRERAQRKRAEGDCRCRAARPP